MDHVAGCQTFSFKPLLHFLGLVMIACAVINLILTKQRQQTFMAAMVVLSTFFLSCLIAGRLNWLKGVDPLSPGFGATVATITAMLFTVGSLLLSLVAGVLFNRH